MLDSQKRILWRLRTAEGHMRAIGDLVEAGEPCEEILIQLKAVRGAIDAIAAQLFYDQVERSKQVICDEPFLNRRSEELERLLKLYCAWGKIKHINWKLSPQGTAAALPHSQSTYDFFKDF